MDVQPHGATAEGNKPYLDDIQGRSLKAKFVNAHFCVVPGGTNTYGKMDNNASVIPRPARNTGVRPIFGLMVEPANGPTGESYVSLSFTISELAL